MVRTDGHTLSEKRNYQKNPIVYHVLVGLLSYRLLEFELQSYGVNPAVISQGSS